MKIKKIVFISLMALFSFLTIFKYSQINNFRKNSKEYVFVIEADDYNINNIKSSLQNLTYQPVDQEKIEEGRYKIRIKCPPDRIGIISNFFSGLIEKWERENE